MRRSQRIGLALYYRRFWKRAGARRRRVILAQMVEQGRRVMEHQMRRLEDTWHTEPFSERMIRDRMRLIERSHE